jgi:hypothetical protein
MTIVQKNDHLGVLSNSSKRYLISKYNVIVLMALRNPNIYLVLFQHNIHVILTNCGPFQVSLAPALRPRVPTVLQQCPVSADAERPLWSTQTSRVHAIRYVFRASSIELYISVLPPSGLHSVWRLLPRLLIHLPQRSHPVVSASARRGRVFAVHRTSKSGRKGFIYPTSLGLKFDE